METLEFDMTTLLPVEAEQATDNFTVLDLDFTNLLTTEGEHGTDISQASGSTTHNNYHSDNESKESYEDTDEEGILEEDDNFFLCRIVIF